MVSTASTNELAGAHRRLERLEANVERLIERGRVLREQREEMRSELEQLKRERVDFDATTAARLDSAAQERRRLLDLESELASAATRESELRDRIAEFERRLSERDRLIAEQEDSAAQLRRRMEEIDSSTDERIEGLRARVATMREELEAAREALRNEQEAAGRREEELEQLRTASGGAATAEVPNGGVVLAADERARMVAQINEAIEIIDRYLVGEQYARRALVLVFRGSRFSYTATRIQMPDTKRPCSLRDGMFRRLLRVGVAHSVNAARIAVPDVQSSAGANRDEERDRVECTDRRRSQQSPAPSITPSESFTLSCT